jgi:hypothetical protein
MNKTLKNILTLGGAFVAYRFYKLYELGDNVIYKPVGIKFIRGGTINDFIIRVKMELLNPTRTIVKMRGIDGRLIVNNQVIGSFASIPFEIKGGLSYFDLDFKVNAENAGVQFVQALLKKTLPVFVVDMNKRLLFFSINEKFAINPNTIPTTDSVLVK